MMTPGPPLVSSGVRINVVPPPLVTKEDAAPAVDAASASEPAADEAGEPSGTSIRKEMLVRVTARVVRLVRGSGSDDSFEAMRSRLAATSEPQGDGRAVLPPGYGLLLRAYDPATATSSSTVTTGQSAFILLATSALVQRAGAAKAGKEADAAVSACLEALIAASAADGGRGELAWGLLGLMRGEKEAAEAMVAWAKDAESGIAADKLTAASLLSGAKSLARFALQLVRAQAAPGSTAPDHDEEDEQHRKEQDGESAAAGWGAVAAVEGKADAAARATCPFQIVLPSPVELQQAAAAAKLV
jgi:hypothetical protein